MELEKGKVILIIDDELEMLELLSQMVMNLEEVENCFIARSMQEAQGVLDNNKIDLVILDHQLMGENSIDYLQREGLALPKTILLTGSVVSTVDLKELTALYSRYNVVEIALKPIATLALHAVVLRNLKADINEFLDYHGADCDIFSTQEKQFLKILMEWGTKVVQVSYILSHVWNTDTANKENLYTLLNNCKRKLKGSRLQIINVRGVGYKLFCDCCVRS